MVILLSHGIYQAISLSDWLILVLHIVLYLNLNAEYQSCYMDVDDDCNSIGLIRHYIRVFTVFLSVARYLATYVMSCHLSDEERMQCSYLLCNA